MLRPFPVRWISLACSGGEFPVLVSREFTGNPLNFHRKGEAGIAVLGLQGQNFPVFSRQTGKDKAETRSPMTVSTARWSRLAPPSPAKLRIRRGVFTSVAELEDAIHDYLDRSIPT
jgi:hypothetical protein